MKITNPDQLKEGDKIWYLSKSNGQEWIHGYHTKKNKHRCSPGDEKDFDKLIWAQWANTVGHTSELDRNIAYINPLKHTVMKDCLAFRILYLEKNNG